MDGVSLAQTNLTGHAEEEAPHLQIRDLHQITLLEKVHTITNVKLIPQGVSVF